MDPRPKVASPPAKPLMLFDGDCYFCRLWIERWKENTGDAVEYEESQKISNRFPEISRDQFSKSVVLIQPDGEVLVGAEAVYRSLSFNPSRRWLHRAYERFPAFAAASEFFYRMIARNRMLASAATRLLWGKDVRRPTYFTTRRWFLRLLGLVYFIAFVSLWVQIDGLIGANGILPVGNFLSWAYGEAGSTAYRFLPTLCWFNSSNGFLHFLCGGGAILSILLAACVLQRLCLALLFVFYLSLTIAGQTFLQFQWDILLLETGFLAMFVAPSNIWSRSGNEPPVSRTGVFLLKLLLFKFMLMSGVVKLTSGDESWWDLTALNYHYWTQPLPNIGGWWADQLPEVFKKTSVFFTYFVEIGAPLLIWMPRRLRLVAFILMIGLQVMIAVTGNYCFFNILTAALCLWLIDDSLWPGNKRRRSGAPHIGGTRSVVSHYSGLTSAIVVALLVIILPLNAWLIYTAFQPEARWPRSLAWVYSQIQPFHVVNGYGLFRVMTKQRHEIIVEGSADGIDWLPYEFKWKSGDVRRTPGWCAPHQPRLDWQMWFAALSRAERTPWFMSFLQRILEGSPDVTRLLDHNPFPSQPPKYMRATLWDYRFTTVAEHSQSSAWWKRRELREYVRTVSLEDFR